MAESYGAGGSYGRSFLYSWGCSKNFFSAATHNIPWQTASVSGQRRWCFCVLSEPGFLATRGEGGRAEPAVWRAALFFRSFFRAPAISLSPLRLTPPVA